MTALRHETAFADIPHEPYGMFADIARRPFIVSLEGMPGPENATDPALEDKSAAIRDAARADIRIYSNGARHVYMTSQEADGTTARQHVSHDRILEAYGYAPKSREYRQSVLANAALKGQVAAGRTQEDTPIATRKTEALDMGRNVADAAVRDERLTAPGGSEQPVALEVESKVSIEAEAVRRPSSAPAAEQPVASQSMYVLQSVLAEQRPMASGRFIRGIRSGWNDVRQAALDIDDTALDWLYGRRQALHKAKEAAVDKSLDTLDAMADTMTAGRHWVGDKLSALSERIIPARFRERTTVRAERKHAVATTIGASVLATTTLVAGLSMLANKRQAGGDTEYDPSTCAHPQSVAEAQNYACYDYLKPYYAKREAEHRRTQQKLDDELDKLAQSTPDLTASAPKATTGFQTVTLRPGSGDSLWSIERARHPHASEQDIDSRVRRDKVANHIRTARQASQMSGPVRITK